VLRTQTVRNYMSRVDSSHRRKNCGLVRKVKETWVVWLEEWRQWLRADYAKTDRKGGNLFGTTSNKTFRLFALFRLLRTGDRRGYRGVKRFIPLNVPSRSMYGISSCNPDKSNSHLYYFSLPKHSSFSSGRITPSRKSTFYFDTAQIRISLVSACQNLCGFLAYLLHILNSQSITHDS
jgi:hypothetical protein